MRLRMLLFGSGLVAVVGSLAAWGLSARTAAGSPGRLQAVQGELHWQSPVPSAKSSVVEHPPTFRLRNVGGTPVRILALKTNCGCASATANPMVVPPGGESMVTVVMDPIEVGVRAATITVETDAPATPTVGLQIMVEGFRRPPYLFQLSGQLFYQEGYTPEEAREIQVQVIALSGVPERPPVVTSDLPFLQLGIPTVTRRPYLVDAKMQVLSYLFPIRFRSKPPNEAFSGEVAVVDPWDSDRVLRQKVFGEYNRPIRVAPSRLMLDVGGGNELPASARFLARSMRVGEPLKVLAEKEDGPLAVEALGNGLDEGGFQTFEVRWKPGRELVEGVYNVTVRPEAGGVALLTVPVRVRKREVSK